MRSDSGLQHHVGGFNSHTMLYSHLAQMVEHLTMTQGVKVVKDCKLIWWKQWTENPQRLGRNQHSPFNKGS